MAEELNSAAGKTADTKIDLRPTLYIGVGGTGMEVLTRLRRKILNALWGSGTNKFRIDKLSDFPIAEFIQFDLDSGALIESGRAVAEDLQFNAVKFTDNEKIVEKFDIERYCRDDEVLDKYPHIKEWLPLTPLKIRQAGIDPSKGAGQIRAISRLYFFDKYAKIRDTIRNKLKSLQSSLSHQDQLDRLGLKMEREKFRIVVVGSVAGGTGSGSFLDMGYLAGALTDSVSMSADIDLMMFLPSGYAGANKDRTEANGYAALMELESTMRGNRFFTGRWDAHDKFVMPRSPYKEVYLVDTGNLAQQHTNSVNDVYYMVADTLFTDFVSGDFSRRKRSVAVNKQQHKISPFEAVLPKGRYADMSLTYSKQYSAFGQAVIDTRVEIQQDQHIHKMSAQMLRAFFGVSSGDSKENRATDKQRDDFMSAHIGFQAIPFTKFPTFSDKNIVIKRSNGAFDDFQLVDDLLIVEGQGSILASVEQRVNHRIDEIKSGFKREEWAAQLRDAIKQMERDAIRDQDSNADATEDRIVKKRLSRLESMKQSIRNQLYTYFDNHEFGGLDFVLSLVQQIKDRIEAPNTGWVNALRLNAERYQEIKDAVRTAEVERLFNNLEQSKSGLFSNKEKQAEMIMDQLRIEIANSLTFHLRAKAATEAALLIEQLSEWLGGSRGVDADGNVLWTGLIAEFHEGRQAVIQMLGQLSNQIEVLQKDLRTQTATLISIPSPKADEITMPSQEKMQAWAEEAFRGIGGSAAVFPKLKDDTERNGLISMLKRSAERKLYEEILVDQTAEAADPLIQALEAMPVNERAEVFRKLLSCAMPWVDATLGGDEKFNSDQYSCFIGVANSDLFTRKFKKEIDSAVPTSAHISPSQINIVETGTIGKLICYVEVAGIPLTNLKGMEAWRSSYSKENSKSNPLPLHVHIDSTQFSHPIAPTPEKLNQLADDFKIYLQAVMLGVITRSERRTIPLGGYQMMLTPGDIRRVGNEKSMRLDGLHPNYRTDIIERVKDAIDGLDANQIAGLAALARYYENVSYAPKKMDVGGVDILRKGFASAMAGELHREMSERVLRKGMSEEVFQKTLRTLEAKLDNWTVAIGDSDEDPYEFEVEIVSEIDNTPRLKRRVIADVFENQLAGLLGAQPAAATPTFAASAPPPLMTPPPLMSPPPLQNTLYFIGVNGTQQGPMPAQQILMFLQQHQLAPAAVKVWREGLPNWVTLAEFQELAYLFMAPPAMSPPPLV